MVRLERIVLENFCQYEFLEATFHRGLTAIVGPNGAGKSNLVSAIAGAFTGRFESAGAKSTNIRNNSAEDSLSSVELNLTVSDGMPAKLRRSLRPANQRLWFNDATYTKEGEIERVVCKWLGMPSKVYVDFAFARQWQIFSVLEMTDADRAQAMGRLFHLDKAEKCWLALGDHLRTLGIPAETVDVDAVKARLAESNNKMISVSSALSSLPTYDPDEIEGIRTAIVLLEHRERAKKERLRVAAALAEADKLLLELTERRDDARRRLDEFNKQYDEGAVSQANKDLQTWVVYGKHTKRISDLRAQLAAHLATEDKTEQPEPAFDWDDDDASLLGQLYSKSDQLNEFCKTFNPATGIAACPTCGTPADTLVEKYHEAKRQLVKLDFQINSLEEDKASAERWTALDKATTRKREVWQNRRELLEKQLEAAALHQELPDRTEDELRQYLSSVENTEQDIKDAADKVNVVSCRHARQEAVVTSFYDRLSEIDAGLNSQTVPGTCASWVTTIDELKHRLAEHQQHEAECARLSVKLDYLAHCVADDEALLETAKQTRKKSGKIRHWRATVEKVRDIFHRDSLPRMVAQSYLEQLETEVNRYLDELGVDFRVKVEGDLEFSAAFPDGRRIPADRLSGGEKVVFALAWRLAVNASFAGDVGLLCLDEPTAGLDVDRLDCLRRALVRMRDLSGASGLQCIIVTHERSLMGLFDHVIELKSLT